MGVGKRFNKVRKPDRRRSKTAGTGTGDLTGLVRVQVNEKTFIFCKPEDVERKQAKWITKQENDKRYLQAKNPDMPSLSPEGKAKNLAKTRERYLKKKDRRQE